MLEIYVENIVEKGRNCSSEAISPLIHNFSYLMLDFCVKTRRSFSLRNKRLFEITEVEITRVDCNLILSNCANSPGSHTLYYASWELLPAFRAELILRLSFLRIPPYICIRISFGPLYIYFFMFLFFCKNLISEGDDKPSVFCCEAE